VSFLGVDGTLILDITHLHFVLCLKICKLVKVIRLYMKSFSKP